jgi:hypothetical protein
MQMPSERWIGIGVVLFLVIVLSSCLWEEWNAGDKITAETAATLADSRKYQAIAPGLIGPEHLRILPHRIEFVKDGVVVYYLDWKNGVVSGSGQITPAARMFMEALSEQIHEECGGKR